MRYAERCVTAPFDVNDYAVHRHYIDISTVVQAPSSEIPGIPRHTRTGMPHRAIGDATLLRLARQRSTILRVDGAQSRFGAAPARSLARMPPFTRARLSMSRFAMNDYGADSSRRYATLYYTGTFIESTAFSSLSIQLYARCAHGVLRLRAA